MADDNKIDYSSLWQEYRESRQKEARDRLIEAYLPLVNVIAGRLAISLPAHVDRDDLISSGFFGLMDAVDRYEPSRGNKFETYAGTRIRGAMLDYLRSKDWIPVSLRQKIKEYERTVARLENDLQRAPTDKEVAAELKISTGELRNLEMQLNVATVVPLEEYIKQETESPLRDPTVGIEKKELKELLAKAIDRLNERERQVISLYYYEELTLREIGLVLNLSEARICQIHTKAVFRLRSLLASFGINSLG